jgi:hypothetical protein
VQPVVITGAGTITSTGLAGNEVGAATDACGNIYTIAQGTGNIYRTPYGGGTTTLALTGWAYGWASNLYMAMDTAKSTLYFTQGWGGNTFVLAKVPVVNCQLGAVSILNNSNGNGWWGTSAIAVDASDNVFFATQGATISEMSADGSTVTQIAKGLSANASGMALDSNSNLYYAIGSTIYELAYSNSSYSSTATVLSSSFGSIVGLGTDTAGNLIVSDQGAGNIPAQVVVVPYEYSSTAKSSSYNTADQYTVASGSTMLSLAYPATIDVQGNIYYENYSSSVNILTPGSISLGQVTPGQTSTGTLNLIFNQAVSSLTLKLVSGDGTITNAGGSCTSGQAYSAGSTCTVQVTYAPTTLGASKGVLRVADGTGSSLAAASISGVGSGAALTLDGGVLSPLGSGYSAPQGIVRDSAGNLYIADASANAVYEVSGSGTLVATLGSGLSKPSSVAFDNAGNLLVADSGNNRIVEIPRVSGSYSTAGQTVLVAAKDSSNKAVLTAGTAISSPTGLSVDANNDLVFADTGNNRVLYIPYQNGWSTASATVLGSGFTAPLSTAIDAAGNLYVANSGAGQIYKFQAPIISNDPLMVAVGFNNPSGLATDLSGSLFIVNQGAGIVERLPNLNGTLNPNEAIEVGGGITNPYGITADGSGNLYVTDSTNSAAYQMTRTSTSEAFGAWPLNTASGIFPIYLENAGNQSLSFATPFNSITGNSGDYLLSTTASNLCADGATLNSGNGCEMDFTFQPSVSGVRTANVTVNSNAVGSAAITLTGTGQTQTSTSTVLAMTSPSSGTPVFAQSLTFTATVSAASGTPTGNVQLLVDDVNYGEAALNSKGVATFVVATGLTGGSHSLQAVYEGSNSFDGSASAVKTLAVGTASTTSSMAINSPYTDPYNAVSGASVSFTLTVTPASVGIPTGTVTFTTGSTTLGTVSLVPVAGGLFQATLSTTALPVGTDVVKATYGGDANYVGSSASGTEIIVAAANVVVTPSGTSITSSHSGTDGTLTFTAVTFGGWTGIVGYACDTTTLPANARCVFTPGQVSVVPSTAAADYGSFPMQLTITIDNPSQNTTVSAMIWWVGGISGLALFFVRRRYLRGAWSQLSLLLAALLLASSATALTACSNTAANQTPTGTSKVTVYSYADPYTSGSTTVTQSCSSTSTAPCYQQSFTVSLTVQ